MNACEPERTRRGPIGTAGPSFISVISFDTSAHYWANLTHRRIAPAQRRRATRALPALAEAGWRMTSELHTVAEAAGILKVRESWLKAKGPPGGFCACSSTIRYR